MKNYKTIQEVRDCDDLSEVQKVKIEYYEDISDLKNALKHYKEVEVYEGQAIDYATEMFHKTYKVHSNISGYIDYKAFCNDLTTGGHICQFNDKYLITNATYL